MSDLSLSVQQILCIRRDIVLFENISFALQAGEILIVEGVNGAGKTSLLQILAGLLPYQAGEIQFNHQPLNQVREIYLQTLLYLGHKAGIHLGLTVKENIAFLAAIHNCSYELTHLLEQLSLSHLENTLTRTLSSGQKRRILLSLLVMSRARLWLLDEPLTALDKTGQAFIQARITAHVQAGGMVILTSHQSLSLEHLTIKRLPL